MTSKAPSLFDWKIAGPAIGDAFKKLDPRLMLKNPVMFVTMVGAVLTTVGIFTAHTDRPWVAACRRIARDTRVLLTLARILAESASTWSFRELGHAAAEGLQRGLRTGEAEETADQ